MQGTSIRELQVYLAERTYPIYIGEGLLDQLGGKAELHRISKRSPLLIISDHVVGELYLERIVDSLAAAGYRVASYLLPAGEASKSLDQLQHLVTASLEAGLDRDSTIIALGGGVIGDVAGFAAATYMRGIHFIQVPTTILAHDSSVGGKVAVNHPLAKNIIGAFHQPEFVLYDTSTLRTLTPREIRSGLAEVAKHGLIRDADFVQWCDEHAEQLLQVDPEALSYALYTGCRIKAEVVSQDEKEGSLRAILNLGHTIGHALEAVAGYGELTHGEAISIGMCGSALLAVRLGVANQEVYEMTRHLLARFGLPTKLPHHYEPNNIMDAMMHDKKFRGGEMVFVLPETIGSVRIQKGIPGAEVFQVLELLREGANGDVR